MLNLFKHKPKFLKKNVDFLPKNKQEELRFIVEMIEKYVHPEKIILFGSFARNNYVDCDITSDPKTGATLVYQSDYDMLVITEYDHKYKKGARIVGHKIRKKFQGRPTSIIFHDISYISNMLEKGNFFFREIITQDGKMLLDRKKHLLPKPRILTPKERQENAQIHYKLWMEEVEIAYQTFEFAYKKGKKDKKFYKKAGFELNQTAENLYKIILLVYTDYAPKLHNLLILNERVCECEEQFFDIFNMADQEQKRLLELLNEYYLKTRFEAGYEIFKEDLDAINREIKKLMGLTESLCKKKIGQLGKIKDE